MFFLSFVLSVFVSTCLLVAASPTPASLSSRELIASDEVIAWVSPNPRTVTAQCYPLNITFTTDRRPSGVYVGDSINNVAYQHPVQTWRNDSSNPWRCCEGRTLITATWDTLSLPEKSIIWFEVDSWDGNKSFFTGSGLTVQASDRSSCLRDNVFGDVSFGTLTGDGVTTTVVSSSQHTSSASSQPIATSTSNGPPSSSDINTAVIVGGIVGGLGTFAVAGSVAFYFLLRRRRGRDSGRAGADAETKPEEDGSAANAFSHVEFSGAEAISPLTLSDSSQLVPVTTYSCPGIHVPLPSQFLATQDEAVIQERDGGHQVERVPPAYHDAVDVVSSPTSPSAPRSSFSSHK
ncbi:hypothetical protein BDY24DRAFT_444590 [Mrakia frigida]|uniref:uncharacterized protein n=1 Tax=Mrakia frigida TaxID=29902 RepID=UPI003FCC21CC